MTLLLLWRILLYSRRYRSVIMTDVLQLVLSRAYRPQRGRGHVTAIHDSVPSKVQIRQWFVTNYSNSCCLDCISAIWTDNVDFTIFSLWI